MAEEKEVLQEEKKVVEGKVKVRKKTILEKMKESLFAEDATNIGDYIVDEVIIPATKKAITDVVSDGINMLIYGQTSSRRPSSVIPSVSRVTYRDYSSVSTQRRPEPIQRNKVFDYGQIVFESYADAEKVLNYMNELISAYGMATVADLYDGAGVTGHYTDNRYGWSDIRNAKIIRVRDGYLLELPPAGVINN